MVSSRLDHRVRQVPSVVLPLLVKASLWSPEPGFAPWPKPLDVLGRAAHGGEVQEGRRPRPELLSTGQGEQAG